MNKLIKAEFFRASHSGFFFKLVILMSVFMLVLPFMTGDLSSQSSVSEAVSFMSQMFVLTSMISGILFCVMLSNIFRSRVYYYEIMNGSSANKIILSKIAVYISFTLVFIIIPQMSVCAVLGAANGTGDIKNIWLTALLYIIVNIHFVCVTILFAMILRNMAVSALFTYLYQVGTQLAIMLVLEANPDGSSKIYKFLNCLPSMQIQKLAQPEYSSSFIAMVISSFLIGTGIMYILTFISYKRKNFR